MLEWPGIGNKNQGVILAEIGQWQATFSMRMSEQEFLDLRERMARIYRVGVKDGIEGQFQ